MELIKVKHPLVEENSVIITKTIAFSFYSTHW